jgi:ubiquinone/menaquinone biosynthesis C-methylase UbiE
VFGVRASQIEQVTAGLRASHRVNAEHPTDQHLFYTAHTVAIHRALRLLLEAEFGSAGSPRPTLLDVGGGRGELALMFARRFDTAMIDVDLDSTQVARALQDGLPPFHVLCGDCSALPVSSDSVDVVIAKEAAHHMPDPKAFFAELSRVVRDAGVVLVIEGVASVLGNRERALAQDRMVQLGATHHRFVLRDILTALDGAFGEARVAWARPLLFRKLFDRIGMGLPRLGDFLDRLWMHLPLGIRVRALVLTGGTAILACRVPIRSPAQAEVGRTEELVDYPIALAAPGSLGNDAIERIRDMIVNEVAQGRIEAVL